MLSDFFVSVGSVATRKAEECLRMMLVVAEGAVMNANATFRLLARNSDNDKDDNHNIVPTTLLIFDITTVVVVFNTRSYLPFFSDTNNQAIA